MDKQNNRELSRMFQYAGKYHGLTILGCVLSGISTILSMLPFVCIWLVIRDFIHVLGQGDVTFAVSSSRYAWLAVLFSALSILLYFFALNCSHLAAFRTATNMRKEAVHHIVTLPLGYFDRNASGRLRKIIDDNAGLTEGFLAHQLPDLTGAVVMPVTVLVLIFLFDWRLGICCLIPMAVSVFFLKQMMGGDNAQFMSKYMTALEGMNKEAVEYIRGIPVVKVFQQTIYSFKNFHAAIEEYQKFASGYALKCRIPLTGFTVTLNGTFVLLIPAAMLILSAVSGQAAYTDVTLDFLFYSLFTPVCATMMNRVMFASEQLMAAKSAVSRVEAILQEEPLPEPDSLQIPKDASVVWIKIIMGASEGDSSLFNSLNLQIAWLNAGADAEIEWQWDGGHVPSEALGDSFSLYVDQMYGEYVDGAVSVSKPGAAGQESNGTAGEAAGKDISGWVNHEDVSAVTFSLKDIAAYRTAGASKAMPAFDVIDYGQEDYVFGNTEKDARHWNTYLLEIFEKYGDVLETLFSDC